MFGGNSANCGRQLGGFDQICGGSGQVWARSINVGLAWTEVGAIAKACRWLRLYNAETMQLTLTLLNYYSPTPLQAPGTQCTLPANRRTPRARSITEMPLGGGQGRARLAVLRVATLWRRQVKPRRGTDVHLAWASEAADDHAIYPMYACMVVWMYECMEVWANRCVMEHGCMVGRMSG